MKWLGRFLFHRETGFVGYVTGVTELSDSVLCSVVYDDGEREYICIPNDTQEYFCDPDV